MNWDGNPKLQFDRRRLERCYKDTGYKEECLKAVKSYEKQPYWNFWKVVFAGWLVRYPRQFFKVIGVSVLFLLFIIVSVTGVEEPSDTGYNVEVIQ